MTPANEGSDLTDKTVIEGQKAPSPYRVAIFCTVGFCFAVIAIVLAILIPLAMNVEMNEGELVGLTVVSTDNEILQVTVMKGTGIAQLNGLYVYFNGKIPEKYSVPTNYEPGTTVFYQYPASMKGTTGTLEIYGHFTNGDLIRVYTETIALR